MNLHQSVSAWQVCPVCGGRGRLPHGFYNTSPAFGSTSTADEVCRACRGRMIIQRPTCTDEYPCDHCRASIARAELNARIGS